MMRFIRGVFIVGMILIISSMGFGKEVYGAVAAPIEPTCGSGSVVGQPPVLQIPSYDYSEGGLVQFHFHFTQSEWNYNTLRTSLYDESCLLLSESNRGQIGGVYLPKAKNILVKVVPASGKYNFEVYDEDTGEFQSTGLGFVSNDFDVPRIAITLSNVYGSNNAPIVETITTPTVLLHKPAAPTKNPTLIIPGIAGSELSKEGAVLWPNINQMLTDVGDEFLDPLSFNVDGLPTDPAVQVTDLVRNPFPGEHYYDDLIQSLEAQGYKENQDLFVFPYDWRRGVDPETVVHLADRIRVLANGGKVDVIAHSTGGLLLKQGIVEYGSDTIGTVIMVAVPNYGAVKAAKVLLFGDHFGVPWLDDQELKKISQNMPGVYHLLPSNNYEGNYFELWKPGLLRSERTPLNFSDTVRHLIGTYYLNSSLLSNANELHSPSYDNFNFSEHGIKAYTLAGCGSPTLSKIIELDAPFTTAAFPIGYQSVFSSGDGTVVTESATAHLSSIENTFYLPNSNHGKLPSQSGVPELIGDLLRGGSSKAIQSHAACKLPGKTISIIGDLSFTISSSVADIELFNSPHFTAAYIPPGAFNETVSLTATADTSMAVHISDSNTDFAGVDLHVGDVIRIKDVASTPTYETVLAPESIEARELPASPVISGGGALSLSLPVTTNPGRVLGVSSEPNGLLYNIPYMQQNPIDSSMKQANHGKRYKKPILPKKGIKIRDLGTSHKPYFLNCRQEPRDSASKSSLLGLIKKYVKIFPNNLSGYLKRN